MERSVLSLPDDAVGHLASYLETPDVAALGATCRQLRATVGGCAPLWRAACWRDWRVDVGAATPAADAHAAWRRSLARYGWGGVYAPARDVWSRIETFAAAHYPALLHGLAPGATLEELRVAEERLGVGLPPALRAVWCIHDGEFPVDDPRRLCDALFGFSEAYGDVAGLGLLRWSNAVELTRRLVAAGRLHPRLVLVGLYTRSTEGTALLLIDTATGLLLTECGGAGRLRTISHDAAVATAAAHGLPPPPSPQEDPWCLLRLLAEHACRLEGGLLRVRRLPRGLQEEMTEAALAALQGPPGGAAGGADADVPTALQAATEPPPRTRRRVAAGVALDEDAAWAATVASNPCPDLPTTYLCAYPEAGEGTSAASTLGVHTHVSCRFLPQGSMAGGAAGWATAACALPASMAAVQPPPTDPSLQPGAAPQLRFAYRVRVWLQHDAGAPDGHGSGSEGGGGEAVPPASASAASPAAPAHTATTTEGGAWPGGLQLHSRRWAINSGDGTPEDVVAGEGVVGLQPVLRALPGGLRTLHTADPGLIAAATAAAAAGAQGAGAAHPPPDLVNGLPRVVDNKEGGGALRPFEYASQSFAGSVAGGHMGGAFTMVPRPGGGGTGGGGGGSFDAAVARFPLEVPGFIF